MSTKHYCDICNEDLGEDHWIYLSFTRRGLGTVYMTVEVRKNPTMSKHPMDMCRKCLIKLLQEA